MSEVSILVIVALPNIFFSFPLFPQRRDPCEPNPDHGQAGVGSLYALRSGDREGRLGGSDQQEAVEGDHQGPELAHLHHQRRLHTAYPVSHRSCLPQLDFRTGRGTLRSNICIGKEEEFVSVGKCLSCMKTIQKYMEESLPVQ